jgi:hypothetical protein
MSGGGGIGQLLPIALAIGATAATGGAAAPALLGLEAGTVGAGMLNAGLIGAGSSALGGIMQGQSGGDILKNSLISGGLGAGTAGLLGGLGGGGAATVPTTDVAPTLSDSGLYNPQTQFSLSPSGAPSSLTPTIDSSLSSDIPKGDITPTIDKYGSPPSSSFFDKAYNPTGITKFAPAMVGALATSDMFKQPGITPVSSGGVPDALKFNFDKSKYKPAIAPYYNGIDSLYPQTPYAQQMRGYADGGTVEQMSRQNSLGNNQMFPQAGLGTLTNTNVYQNPINTPESTNVIGPTDRMTDTYAGAMKFAKGGDLGFYSDGGRMLKGPGDGMSDDIPAQIGSKQPARLADGEFVVPADVVSHLGNGSTDAGAKHLYAMMDKVRKARTGNPKQGKQINPNRYLTA